jgi:hypothetical protein
MTDDPYQALREQLRATAEAAELLARGTAEARAQPAPPAGWATPDDHAARQQELQALLTLVEALRELVPDELKALVRDVLRQLLVLARTLVEWWMARVDGPAAAPASPGVEDIPID